MLARWPLLSGQWRYIGFRSRFFPGVATSKAKWFGDPPINGIRLRQPPSETDAAISLTA